MNKGCFVNYQLAEAILKIKEYDISKPEEKEAAEKALEELKVKWIEQDKIIGYGKNIGCMLGMDSITVENIIQISRDLQQYDTYSTECAGNMQYCMNIEDGQVIFDFSYLSKIADLARADGKKICIDSAIVFGDHFPENMKGMEKSQIIDAIAIYTQTLVKDFGDCIDRIDVLNSIFQRKDVKSSEGKTSEQFWLDVFGEDYATEVLKIVRENLGDYKNINLCWNEFYITNPNEPQKLIDFEETIHRTQGIDIIGIQDKFRSNSSPEEILSALTSLTEVLKEHGIQLSITELGCGIVGTDIDTLKSSGQNSEQVVDNINANIQQIIKSIENFASTHDDVVCSVESRYSDEFDPNHKYISDLGYHNINTTGKTSKSLTFQEVGKGTVNSFTNETGKAMEAIDILVSGVKTKEELKEGQTQGES